MIKEGFFPTLVYAEDFQLDTNELAHNIMKWSQENECVQKTNVNGWHSEPDMNKRPEYKPLVNELFKMVYRIFDEEWFNIELVFELSKRSRFTMDGCNRQT